MLQKQQERTEQEFQATLLADRKKREEELRISEAKAVQAVAAREARRKKRARAHAVSRTRAPNQVSRNKKAIR